jgi:hypothetical protein
MAAYHPHGNYPLIQDRDRAAAVVKRFAALCKRDLVRSRGLPKQSFEPARRGAALFIVGATNGQITVDVNTGLVSYYDGVLVHEEVAPLRAAAFMAWLMREWPRAADAEDFSDIMDWVRPASLAEILS